MIQIEHIAIYYFRSIYSLQLKNIRDVCVLSGKNDTGKSNILKALNLFFNNQVDWRVPFDFTRDFSSRRLQEVRKSIKGKQFIRVKLSFIRGEKSPMSLPDKFEVTKTWLRGSVLPDVKSTIEKQFNEGKIKTTSKDRAIAGLQRYLNSIRFEYVPAIKDRDLFRYCLGLLQDTILKKKTGETSIQQYIESLNKSVEKSSRLLSEEFIRVCGIKTDIRLPKELAELFRAFFVATETGYGDAPLAMRGDGIQSRFIASLMHYVASNSRLRYIWGFEEPENCLEHGLATKLGHTILDDYSRHSQIIITSHSPAFITLQGNNASMFRIFSGDYGTSAVSLTPEQLSFSSEQTDLLEEDLGLTQLRAEHQREFEEKLAEVENDKIRASEIIRNLTQPTLLTEGESDVLILNESWKRIQPNQSKTFKIESCNTTPRQNQSSAGVGILTKALQSHRPSSQVIVGLYDRDSEGLKEYNKLGNNFNKYKIYDAMYHKNGRAAAFLIPIPSDRQEYAKAENLKLEFLFDDEYLTKQVDGRGLKFVPKTVSTRVDGGPTLFSKPATEPQYRDIEGDKMYFAEKIMPTFPNEAFFRFSAIFDLFESILKDIAKQ